MNNDLLDFMNGVRNSITCEAVISREKNNTGWEYTIITIDDIEIYKFWHNPKIVKSDKPKHTGGKASYVKVITKTLERYPDLSIEASGFLLKMTDYINWNSNLLIKKRAKKALIVSDFCKIIKRSNKTIVKILKELKDTKLLHHDKDGYRISQTLLQKGGK